MIQKARMIPLADGTIFHIEFRSGNDQDMPYGEGIYCLLLGQKYRRRVRQVADRAISRSRCLRVGGRSGCSRSRSERAG